MPDTDYDVLIAGCGIVGLATALALVQARPGIRVGMVDKEPRLGAHQSGHNSGVLHAGIYYTPGSLKAKMAVSGRAEMVDFCARHGVNHEICGKVIVATTSAELPRLHALAERGRANGVPNELIGPERLAELEPHAAGVAAIHVPVTGIVDFAQVCEVMASLVQAAGAEIRLSTAVTSVQSADGGAVVTTTDGDIRARWVVNCAGLQSDRVARAAGIETDVQIVPFRGEYYKLVPKRRHLVRNIIYPVPDPSFPFLGVHFTRRIGGDVEAGPNAVLALAREGYRWRDVRWADVRETLAWPGTRALARKYWRTGLGEMWRSANKHAFVRALQCLVPDIRAEDLQRAPAGVRAQALARDGGLLDDFAIREVGRVVNVLNAPSPAATASLPIGRTVASLITDRLA
jgi:L-2-hydroxyglutarate oxidase